MRPMIEKLPLSEDTSFVACTFRTPQFEVPWHQHIEYELILFTEGEGGSFIGNYVGAFTTGDIFFLGANLPHTFQRSPEKPSASAVVVQFREDFWGAGFLQLPECRLIRELFQASMQGLKINGACRQRLVPMLQELEGMQGFGRIIRLCECLLLVARSGEYETVSTQEVSLFQSRNKERIDRIFQYTIDFFQEPIHLADIARNAGMSVPAFCQYFKKTTKKTYIDFLNEVRVGYACKQLIDTRKSIETICYESGFNTLANFNKQFQKIKKITPSGYRKNFGARIAVL